METRCKFSIKCDDDDPNNPPIAYCVLSNEDTVICEGKQEDKRRCPFWSGLATKIQ